MLLEHLNHEESTFITLTYNEENETDTLHVKHYQNFLKQLRNYTGKKFRYYLVGEYGDQTGRPHYHAILFGLSQFDHLYVERAWGKGFTDSSECNAATIDYVAGYVTKKADHDLKPIDFGLLPEFARMSLRPAIGTSIIPSLTAAIKKHGQEQLFLTGDVPHFVQMGKSQRIHLGSYIIKKLRQSIGMTDDDIQSAKTTRLQQTQTEMQTLHTNHEKTTGKEELSTLKLLKEEMIQPLRNYAAKRKLFNTKRTI